MKEALMICKDFLPHAALAQYPSCPLPSSFFPAFRKTLFPPLIPVNNPSTSDCACAKSLQLCQTLCNSVDCSHQAPLSMRFPREEYRSGLPFPSPGDLPDPGIEPASPATPALAGRFFTTNTWEAHTSDSQP